MSEELAEQQVAALLRLLRPAPAAWVKAASEIPRLERELEHGPDLRAPTTERAAETSEPEPTNSGA